MGNDRRKAGEESYRQKFEELGLAESFEFVKRVWESDTGKKVTVRCKSCGKIFDTWGFNQMLRGRQDHLLCIHCGASSDDNDVWERSPKCDEAMGYYIAGHSVRETAEKFGVQKYQVNNAVKTRRLSNGHSFREKGRNCLSKHNAKQKADALDHIKARLESLGFEYISGCEKVRYRCKLCGNVQEHCRDHVRDGNIVCHKCEHEKALIRQTEQKILKRKESERRRKEKEAERIKNNPLGLSNYQLEKEKKMDEVFVCKVCGKEYTPRQYMESAGLTLFSNVGYCSGKCKRRAENKAKKLSPCGKSGNYYQRAKKYGCIYVPGITLKKLIQRDGLQCKICGKMCNPDDHSWRNHSGPMRPSVDHIIPLAKGGPHDWDNVQVAHIICNSAKGDKVVNE